MANRPIKWGSTARIHPINLGTKRMYYFRDGKLVASTSIAKRGLAVIVGPIDVHTAYKQYSHRCQVSHL